jgi:hypothetical protein
MEELTNARQAIAHATALLELAVAQANGTVISIASAQQLKWGGAVG